MRLFAAAVLVVLLAAPASSAAPRASDSSVRLGDVTPVARAAAAGHGHGHARRWTSRVVRTRRPVHVLGLRWRTASEHLDAEVRVRTRSGGWRRWTELGDAHSSRGSDPVWAGGARAVQVRVAGRVRGLRLHLVSVRGGRAPVRARAAARRQAGSPPAIIPRSEWGADTQCTPRDRPSHGEVQVGFVHHTVSANEYGPEDSAAMVLGICRFHRNGNGWDDIGYNFLVDRYGQVFEGRAGGVDQPVVGAQAQGFNSVSTGVANLGTYSDVPQSTAAVDAMARLLAWKLPLHGAPVTGEVTVTSEGGSSNRHPAGRAVTFERISGHRDGNRTECPGARLFAQLPDLRARAAGLQPVVAPAPVGGTPARLTLQVARRALAYPEPARLTGQVLDADGAGVPGVRVRLQLLTAKGFRATRSAVSGADGTWSAELPTARNRIVRVLAGKLVSNRVRVTVAPALSVPAPARRVRAGRRAVVLGTLQPRRAHVRVLAHRQLASGRFARPVVVRGRSRGGRFRLAVPLVRPGLYRLRVRFAGDRLNAPAQVEHWVRAVRNLASSPAPASPGPSGSSGGASAG